jgi:hypothetical protein
MTSAINPNDIDGTYPVAGQDNNSQGFRDNFTNTKTNFQYAANEITDLQSKAVLKAALVGTVLNNDMAGSPLSNASISDFGAIVANLGSLSGTVTINYVSGHYQTVTTSGSIELAFTLASWPADGNFGIVRVAITVTNIGYTVTLPATVSVGTSNLQGYNAATRVITYNKTGTYTYDFTSSNGGTTVSVFDASQNMDPIYLPSTQNLGTGIGIFVNVNTTTTATYFSTTGGSVSTLPPGANGQIKTLMMNAEAGEMTITVNNAGWKTSGDGTVQFTAIGSAVTLQYINNKWFCIGNNGATFA